jgi:DegV family protein with EDD domain
MSKYMITCSSTVDLSEEFLKERNIPYACFTFTADGKTYKDDYGKSYPIDKFYEDIKNGMQPITSQVNVEAYTEMFEPLLKEGYDIIHITLSSGISGTYNSANSAASILNDKYENKVHVVDSLCASSGYGMLVTMAKDNLDNGMSLEDNLKWIEENKTKIIHWFFSTDLSSFIRGGRISKTAGLVAGVLQICPVMCVSKVGKLEVFDKVRTKKKAIKTVVNKMLEEIGPDYDGYVYLCQSACYDDAKAVVDLIKETFKNVQEVKIFNIGTVIGTHTGPGTVALFFEGKERAI